MTVALGLATGAFDAYRRVFVDGPAAPLLSRPRPVRPGGFERPVAVDAVTDEADGVVSVTLRAPDRTALPAWRPGAHIDLALPSGLVRQYSLCGDPTDRSVYRIAVRLLGAGSAEVHGLRRGDQLLVRGPRNAFPLVPAQRHLFIAGGIGITPILPMLRTARAPRRLVYLGRSRASMPFLHELAGHPVDVVPDDECGPPDVAALVAELRPGTSVHVCGPAPLIDGVRAALAPDVPFVAERFTPPAIVDADPLTVTLARTGERVAVAADESVLAAVQRLRPDVGYSCRQGFCGSCTTPLAGGGSTRLCVDRLDGAELAL